MKSKQLSQKLAGQGGLAFGLAALVASTAAHAENQKLDWQEKAIAPVCNPIFFEDPRIYTEVRPIFMQHWLPDNFDFNGGSVPLGGEARVYAAQIRVKLTDRLALIATKDGYVEFRPDSTLGHA